MLRVQAVIERDIRKFMRNPVIMVMAVVMPLAYLIILGNSFQGKLMGLPVAVVDKDDGAHGRVLAENLGALVVGPKTVILTWLSDEGKAVEDVRMGKYKAAVIIPPDFSRRVDEKTGPEVGLFVDNTDQISENALTGAIDSAVAGMQPDFVPHILWY